MNILIINHYAGSPKFGMEYRPFYLAKEWVKQGHQVTIVASSHSHLRIHQPIVKHDLYSENIGGIKYLWLKTPSYKTSGIKRITNMLIFVFKLFIHRKKIVKLASPDVVIASSTYPLDIYPAHNIAKKSKAKLVFELHDMWPLSPMLIGGYSKCHPFIWLMQKAENFACKKSDVYISLLGNAEEYLQKHGLKKNRFFHIPNGFSLEELNENNNTLPGEHERLLSNLQNQGKTIVGYAGGHAPSNALDNLIKASASLANEQSFVFVLVGSGPQKEELMQMVKENNLLNIFFLPPVAKTSILTLLSKFDIFFAGGTKSILHSYGTSFNKITDYMLAEKPIIFAVDEPNSLVEKVGCGLQIPAENKLELIKSIKFIATLSQDERLNMGKKGRKYALAELNYTSLAKKFINAIEQI